MTTARVREILANILVLGLIFLWLVFAVRSESSRTSDLRDDLVTSCERGNILRQETNGVIASLQEFLHAAADARERTGTPEDAETAERYREISQNLNPIELPNCEAIIGGR